MNVLHRNDAFAPLDADLHLTRIAGGNETEVYRSDDHQFVIKLKAETAGSLTHALADAQWRKQVAQAYAKAIGTDHSVPTYFLIAENDAGEAQALAVQHYYQHARPLAALDYARLPFRERYELAGQLIAIIGRNVRNLLKRGWMPDIYGRSHASSHHRKQSHGWRKLPERLWSFIVQRSLLRSHNLLRTPEGRVILIDYDPMPHGRLYQLVYYSIRLLLFGRDLALISLLVLRGAVPPA